jgi:hypothetical protein
MLRSGFHQHAIGGIIAAWFNAIGVLFGTFSPSSGGCALRLPYTPFQALRLLSLLFVLTIVPTANAQRITVTTIPSPPNATFWAAYGINQLDAVTGKVDFGSDTCAFLYTDNHVKPICSLVNGQGGLRAVSMTFAKLLEDQTTTASSIARVP